MNREELKRVKLLFNDFDQSGINVYYNEEEKEIVVVDRWGGDDELTYRYSTKKDRTPEIKEALSELSE